MKVCISLNLFAGLNCSWPVSIFSRLLLETCTYAQVKLNVGNEQRQGTGVDALFSEEMESPISLQYVKESGENIHCSITILVQLLNHHLVLYQILAVFWLWKEGVFELCIFARDPCLQLPFVLSTGSD